MFDIALWNQYKTTLADGFQPTMLWSRGIRAGTRSWDRTRTCGRSLVDSFGKIPRRQIMSNAADLENSGRRSLGEQVRARARIKSVVEEYEHLPMSAYLLKLAHLISNK